MMLGREWLEWDIGRHKHHYDGMEDKDNNSDCTTGYAAP